MDGPFFVMENELIPRNPKGPNSVNENKPPRW